jgi:hypothetical protein
MAGLVIPLEEEQRNNGVTGISVITFPVARKRRLARLGIGHEIAELLITRIARASALVTQFLQLLGNAS